MNKSESKYFNTAVKMDKAFLGLLAQKDFDYITVKEICASSGVSRSTFYLHYETVNDLLLETVEYINSRFYSYFTHLKLDTTRLHSTNRENLNFITPEYLTPWLSFVRENRILYSTVLKKFDTLQMNGEIFGGVYRTIETVLERYGIPEQQRRYMMLFYLEGMNAIVKEWIRNDCRDSVAVIIDVIQECVRP